MILYDSEQDDVQMLNSSARLVYNLCWEGKNGITKIENEIRGGFFQLEDDQDVCGHIRECIFHVSC